MPFNARSLVFANSSLTQSVYNVFVAALYQNPARGQVATTYSPSSGGSFSVPSGTIRAATGKRVALFGTLPSNYGQSEYFMISLGPTTFRLATTLENALNGTALVPSTTPSGLMILDQNITADDDISSLVSYEIPGINRVSTYFEGSTFNAAANAAVASTPTVQIVNPTTSGVNISHLLIIMGGSATNGSVSYSYFALEPLAGTIPANGGSLSAVIQHRARSVAN